MVPEGGTEQVLLVDDNSTNLQVLFKSLEGSGYRLLAARDGETALHIAREAHPALILLDVMMPGMDGFEVCERLKADEATADIAVIFLSAMTDSQSKVHGLAVGGVDYIAKPFQADEVLARVRTHIKIQRLEHALERRNVELEDENLSILNSVEEAIFGLDKQGRISSLNPQAVALTGWPEADVVGEPLAQLALFPNNNSLNNDLERMFDSGLNVRKERVALASRDGRKILVSLSATARHEGGAVLVLRDISEWVRNQEALQGATQELDHQRQHLAHIERLSTGGEMAAGIAHEVNQPLTAVVNYARVAQRMLGDIESEKRDKLNEVMAKIVTQAERASEVIKRMRSYVKKPSGGKISLDLNTVLEEVIALAEVDSRMNGINVSLHPGQQLPRIEADEVQIQQVALNLIRNAMESTVAASSDAPVAVESYVQGSRVGFRVSDCGRGMDPEVEKQLFSPFVSSKEGGMGIGLSVSQSIMQAHGGDVYYRPNPEGGAIFSCELAAES